MTRRTALIIFLAALILRLGYLGTIYDGPESLRAPDSIAFEVPAKGLLLTGAISTPSPEGGFMEFRERPPGYIVWVAAHYAMFSESPIFPVIGQLLLDSLTAVLIGLVAGFLNPRAALVAGLLAAVNLNMIIHAAMILGDSLFLFMLTAGIATLLAYVRKASLGLALATGALFGAAWLARPVMLVFVAVLVAIVVVAGRRQGLGLRRAVSHAIAAGLVMVLGVAPIYVQNYLRHDRLAYTTQTGTAAFNWYFPLAREYAEGVPPPESRALMQSRLAERLRAQGKSEIPKDPFAVSAEMQAIAKTALLELGIAGLAKAWISGATINIGSPAAVAAPPVQAMDRPSFFETEGANPFDKIWRYLSAEPAFSAIIILAAGLTGLCRIIAAAALVLGRRYYALGPMVVLVTVALYFMAVTGPITGIKYRLPLEPTLDALLAIGLIALFDRLSGRRGHHADGTAP